MSRLKSVIRCQFRNFNSQNPKRCKNMWDSIIGLVTRYIEAKGTK